MGGETNQTDNQTIDKTQEMINLEKDEKGRNPSSSSRRSRRLMAKQQCATNQTAGGDSCGDEEGAMEDTEETSSEEKSRTFRNRRLTLPRHHTEMEWGASTPDASMEPSPGKKQKTSAAAAKKKPLISRVHHAGHLPPVSPRTKSLHPLYTTLQDDIPVPDRASKPAWRHRHTFDHDEQDHKLPFPRHVVGTYSVHGVEPVYDSEYEDDDVVIDEDDDEDWMEPVVHDDGTKTSKTAESKTTTQQEQPQDEEAKNKLTTVAKINQDRGGVAYPYANSHRTALFAAYDGHGQGGELVSQYALHEVQRRLEKHPKFATNIARAFKEVFIRVDEDLTKEPLIEPLYAGTTACVVLIRDSHMTISNAGDSRAVLARRRRGKQEGEWQAIDLSEDQNPDVPEEQARIEKAGGFVSPPPEPGLSARVWLDDAYSQIGLAMARSIGDHAVAPVGVIAEPVVTFHEIQDDDDFLILATDGVWEFIDSDEAVRIVGEHLSDGATKACQALIEAAASKWHEEEGSYRDDITALVVCLQNLWDCDS